MPFLRRRRRLNTPGKKGSATELWKLRRNADLGISPALKAVEKQVPLLLLPLPLLKEPESRLGRGDVYGKKVGAKQHEEPVEIILTGC